MTQSIIDSMYNALLRDTLGQVDARILLPAEQCYLLRGHHLPRKASLSFNATSCKEAVETDAGRRQQLGRKFRRNQTSHGSLCAASIVARGTNSLPCWQTSAATDAASACPNSGHGRGDSLPLARRLSLMGRHRATAALSNESHLLRALRDAAGDGPLVLFGDSIMRDLFKSAICELLRSNAHDDVAFAVSRLEYMGSHEVGGSPAVDTSLSKLASLERKLRRISARAGSIVVASVGVHYNNDDSVTTTTPNRSILAQHAARLLGLLSGFRAECRRPCDALLLTSTAQHFATPDGAYHAAITPAVAASPSSRTPNGLEHNLPAPPDAYACKAWPATRSAPAGWPVHASHSPSTWRVDDVMKVRRERFADVPVIPLHLLSSTWWDAHPGLRPDKSHATTDCTHFCASPFLFEPVWWAVRTALAAPRR
jgi:hypothetical protein